MSPTDWKVCGNRTRSDRCPNTPIARCWVAHSPKQNDGWDTQFCLACLLTTLRDADLVSVDVFHRQTRARLLVGPNFSGWHPTDLEGCSKIIEFGGGPLDQVDEEIVAWLAEQDAVPDF